MIDDVILIITSIIIARKLTNQKTRAKKFENIYLNLITLACRIEVFDKHSQQQTTAIIFYSLLLVIIIICFVACQIMI
jgi:hypothetical protein